MKNLAVVDNYCVAKVKASEIKLILKSGAIWLVFGASILSHRLPNKEIITLEVGIFLLIWNANMLVQVLFQKTVTEKL